VRSYAVAHNPVVKRPKAETNEGKTPALGDDQAWALLEAPPADTLKGKRDLQTRQGVIHLRVFGKGSKIRYVPAHPLGPCRGPCTKRKIKHGKAAFGLFDARRNAQRTSFFPIKPDQGKNLCKWQSKNTSRSFDRE
jgi:hypothetical protein